MQTPAPEAPLPLMPPATLNAPSPFPDFSPPPPPANLTQPSDLYAPTPTPTPETLRHRLAHMGGGGRSGSGKNKGRQRDLLSEMADADSIEVRVSYRRAKTQALAQNPALAVYLQRADASSTDKEKRDWLRQYYTQLFAAVRKIDPSQPMKDHVELLSLVAEQRYDPQRRTVAGEEEIIGSRGGGRGRRL